mmetsp:Transcript_59717/g.99070  ORF Transcript_59717/g.99070 Transcript_59717/m.99070 type:complete len:387 (-) Transcript_59717:407-1567(-)
MQTPASRVTLTDFRALQAQLLEMKQKCYEASERENLAMAELRKLRATSFPPPPPRRGAEQGNGYTCSYPTELNPFGPANISPSVAGHGMKHEVCIRRETNLQAAWDVRQVDSLTLRQQLQLACSELAQVEGELASALSLSRNADEALQRAEKFNSASDGSVHASAASSDCQVTTSPCSASVSSSPQCISSHSAIQLAILNERIAAVQRSQRQRALAEMRLVFHGWRAAHANTRILRNMSNIAVHLGGRPSVLLQSTAHAEPVSIANSAQIGDSSASRAIAVIAACLTSEIHLCESELHAEALRKAELCSRLWRQLDECNVAHTAQVCCEQQLWAADVSALETELAAADAALHHANKQQENSRSILRDLGLTLARAQQLVGSVEDGL